MGALCEAAGESLWMNACNVMNWDEGMQVLHLEAFIRAKGLMYEFGKYADDCAAEELKEALASSASKEAP